MKRKVFAIGFLIMLLALCVETTSVYAQADQVTIKPTDDTYTNLQNPNSNYGGQTHIEFIGSPSNKSTVFLKFSLSSIPIGAVIDNVKLQLYTTFVSEPWYHIVVAYFTNNSWSESTLTDNGYHSLDGGIYLEGLSQLYVMWSNQLYSWDETTALNIPRTHNSTEITLVLLYSDFPNPPSSYVWFASKEYSTDYSPRLIVHWSGVVPEFSSWLILPLFVAVTLSISIVYFRKHKQVVKKP